MNANDSLNKLSENIEKLENVLATAAAKQDVKDDTASSLRIDLVQQHLVELQEKVLSIRKSLRRQSD